MPLRGICSPWIRSSYFYRPYYFCDSPNTYFHIIQACWRHPIWIRILKYIKNDKWWICSSQESNQTRRFWICYLIHDNADCGFFYCPLSTIRTDYYSFLRNFILYYTCRSLFFCYNNLTGFKITIYDQKNFREPTNFVIWYFLCSAWRDYRKESNDPCTESWYEIPSTKLCYKGCWCCASEKLCHDVTEHLLSWVIHC